MKVLESSQLNLQPMLVIEHLRDENRIRVAIVDSTILFEVEVIRSVSPLKEDSYLKVVVIEGVSSVMVVYLKVKEDSDFNIAEKNEDVFNKKIMEEEVVRSKEIGIFNPKQDHENV